MENAISSDLIRGHIDAIILNTLLDGDKFAQQISDAIEQKSDNKYQINQATLYSSLKRLENLSYIKSYWNDALDGRRKFFKLTETGKSFIDNNLTQWSFSRSIIDKLIDAKTEPQVKTVYIQKESPVYEPIKEESVKIQEQLPTVKQDEQKENTDNKETYVPEKEVNFRSILNCLVKPSNRNNKKSALNEETETKKETLTFTETINTATVEDGFNSKIEFEDLAEDAKNNGYKIRISSKKVAQKGRILVNKLNLFSAILIVFLSAIEILAVSLGFGSHFNSLKTFILIASGICLIYPVISLIIELTNSKKTVVAIESDSINVCAICIFNVILVDFALNMLFNLNFSDAKSVIIYFISPIALSINAIIFFIFRRLVANSKFFKTK